MFATLASIEFTHPAALVLLTAIVPVMLAAWWFRQPAPLAWRWLLLLLRCGSIALLTLALARPVDQQSVPETFVVLAVDQSASIGLAAKERMESFVKSARESASGDRMAILPFAAASGRVEKIRDTASVSSALTAFELSTEASHPAAAILLAAASISPEYVPHVVLLSDGVQTDGDLFAAARASGATVSTVRFEAFTETEVGISRVTAGAASYPGHPFDITVVIAANRDGQGEVELAVNSTVAERRLIKTTRGETRHRFRVVMPEGGVAVVRAQLSGFQDRHVENNRGTAVVVGKQRPRVLLFAAPSRSEFSFENLLRENGFDVTVRSIEQAGTVGDEPFEYDLVILSGVAADAISQQTAEMIGREVRDRDTGLLVLGGDATFGEAVLASSPLAGLLPVRAIETKRARQDDVAMVLVIDKSRSMLKQNRIGLAKLAAKKTVELLSPSDHIGVIAYGDDAEWVSEIMLCRDKRTVIDRIDELTPGGGTNMYPAMDRAFLALEQTEASRRHMIVLTDGVSAPGDFQRLAGQLAKAGITVATVSISDGADQTILKDISRIAEGRHYHCDDPADVPKILQRETKTATAINPKAFKPFVIQRLPRIDMTSIPSLSGHTATTPKQDAELILSTTEGDPLLIWSVATSSLKNDEGDEEDSSVNRTGGVVVALTVDLNDSTTAQWRQWPELGRFLATISRLAITTRHVTSRLATARRGNDLIIELEARTDTSSVIDGLKPTLTLERLNEHAIARGPVEKQLMQQVAPGRYQATSTVSAGDAVRLAATFVDRDGNTTLLERGVSTDYADEFRLSATNRDLLQAVAESTGGWDNPSPGELFDPLDQKAERKTSLWPYLLLAGFLLFVAEILIHRYVTIAMRPRFVGTGK